MNRLKTQWEEFLLVIDSSADTELTIVAATVLPTFVLVFGAWSISTVDLSGPFASLTAAVLSRLDFAFIGLAGLLYWKLGSIAVMNYKRAREELLGPGHS